MSKSIPMCFFPMKKILIDDDKEFAESILLQKQNNNLKVFNSPQSGLNFLLNEYKPQLTKSDIMSFDEKENDSNFQQKINFNFKKFKENLLVNSDYSVLFIDHHMPEMLGVDFLKQISHLPIKKVLMTGEKDLSLAIDAFNNDLVDAYLRKDDPSLMNKILTNEQILEWKYFTELSQFLYELPNNTYYFLKNINFVITFETFINNNKIVAFCLIDTQGTFLMRDEMGIYKYFLIRDRIHLNQMSIIAKEECASISCIKKLESGLFIPFFNELDFWNIPGKDWDLYLLPATPITNDNSLVWAYSE